MDLNSDCKKLVKFLLPVHLIFLIVLVLFMEAKVCSGNLDSAEAREPGKKWGFDGLAEVANRIENVKAKWKGEHFWSQAAANLTLMESQKMRDAAPIPMIPTTLPTFISTTRTSQKSKKSPNSSRKASSSRPTLHRDPDPDSDLDLDIDREPISEYRSTSLDPKNITISPTNTTSTSKPRRIKGKLTKSKRPIKVPIKIGGQGQGQTQGQSTTKPKPQLKYKAPKPPRPTRFPTKKLPRTTLTADLSQYGQDYYLEYESGEENSPDSSKESTTTPSSTVQRLRPQRPQISQSQRNSTRSKIKNFYPSLNARIKTTLKPRLKLNVTQPPDHQDRATLTADLGQYGQDYTLEYESDEEPLTFEKDSNSTNPNGTLNIQFYPKTPVNLLYILQTLASNMQPIRVQSPLGGTQISGEIPSTLSKPIPMNALRVPIKVNPPTSPFLFSMDLDSFFTRMAISLFYSGLAIAPLIYMLVGGLGSVGGIGRMNIAPFGGKKRRKRSIGPGLKDKKVEAKGCLNFGYHFDKILKSLEEIEDYEDFKEQDHKGHKGQEVYRGHQGHEGHGNEGHEGSVNVDGLGNLKYLGELLQAISHSDAFSNLQNNYDNVDHSDWDKSSKSSKS